MNSQIQINTYEISYLSSTHARTYAFAHKYALAANNFKNKLYVRVRCICIPQKCAYHINQFIYTICHIICGCLSARKTFFFFHFMQKVTHIHNSIDRGYIQQFILFLFFFVAVIVFFLSLSLPIQWSISNLESIPKNSFLNSNFRLAILNEFLEINGFLLQYLGQIVYFLLIW